MSDEHWIPYHMILKDDQPQHAGWDDVLEARRKHPGELSNAKGGVGEEYLYRCKRCRYQPEQPSTWQDWFTYDSAGQIKHVCPECHNDPLVALTVQHVSVGQKSDG